MSNTAPSRADPVVVFALSRWCQPQETSQPHPPPTTPGQVTSHLEGCHMDSLQCLHLWFGSKMTFVSRDHEPCSIMAVSMMTFVSRDHEPCSIMAVSMMTFVSRDHEPCSIMVRGQQGPTTHFLHTHMHTHTFVQGIHQLQCNVRMKPQDCTRLCEKWNTALSCFDAFLGEW